MNGHFNKRGRNQRRRQGVNPNRALDSNGPDVRIRGTAQQIYDKYLALARDATSSGDRVKAENYLQHAEHYFRLMRTMQGPNAPSPDMSAGGDSDVDGDQPTIGEAREQRQPSSSSFEAEEEESDEQPAGAQPSGSADEQQKAAPRENDQRRDGGDPEGRRRRRRPRRPREEGAAAEAGEDVEPAPAS